MSARFRCRPARTTRAALRRRIAALKHTMAQRDTAVQLLDEQCRRLKERLAQLIGTLAYEGLRIERDGANRAIYVATLDGRIIERSRDYGKAARAGLAALIVRGPSPPESP